MEMDNRFGKVVYLVIGLIFLSFTILMAYANISENTFSQQTLTLCSLTVMSFCLSYLYPQFKRNNDTTKKIREKGVFINYFLTIGYLLIFLLITELDILTLNTFEVISSTLALSIITLFLSFVIFSKHINKGSK